ncbi:MAG: hypothetical protein MPJ24_04625 [Pirellulaceae bacterium]|nr:hypothetical protein [Pirellulaceae bacterium]
MSPLETFLAAYEDNLPQDEQAQRERLQKAAWIQKGTENEIYELVRELRKRPSPVSNREAEYLLAAALQNILFRIKEIFKKRLSNAQAGNDLSSSHVASDDSSSIVGFAAALRHELVSLYFHLGSNSAVRYLLLMILAQSYCEADIKAFAKTFVADPPNTEQEIGQAIAPFLQNQPARSLLLYPEILEGLADPLLGSIVLDLGNFLVRQNYTSSHPARTEVATLVGMLNQLTDALAVIEQRPPNPEKYETIEKQVHSSIAILISLADSLALMGAKEAIEPLKALLSRKHRRLQAEAASALLALGDSAGLEVFCHLVKDGAVRKRILAYAEELGVLNKLPEEFQTPEAKAEGELCEYLALPAQMGLAPQKTRLVKKEALFWPGYSEPVECFLLEYTYSLGENQYTNTGIVGPYCHTFSVDLSRLPAEDQFAIFAGFHVEDPSIYRLRHETLTIDQQKRVEKLYHSLETRQIQFSAEGSIIGSFFDQIYLVVLADYHEEGAFTVAEESGTVYSLPISQAVRPVGFEEAVHWYLGLKLLSAYNADFSTQEREI